MTDPKLTDLQALALATVKDRPRLTVEDYANMIGNTPEVYSAFSYLIFKVQMLQINESTGEVNTKGIIQ